MRELKTKPLADSVPAFLAAIPDAARRKDCKAVARLMQKVTGAKPRMWGSAIIGFGDYRYQGRSGSMDWFLTGFSPRKQALTVYLMGGFNRHPALMKKLGKYKTGKGCLYLKSLDDVDQAVLEELVAASVKQVQTGK